MTRADDAGAEEDVEVFRAAIGPLAGRATRAMDFPGTEMLGSVERDRDPPIEALERGENTFGVNRLVKHRIERGRWGAVQHFTDMVAGRDGTDPEQGLAV